MTSHVIFSGRRAGSGEDSLVQPCQPSSGGAVQPSAGRAEELQRADEPHERQGSLRILYQNNKRTFSPCSASKI